MYPRKTTRRNRDGARVSYLRLVHNVWDPEKGHPRAQAELDDQWDIAITRSRALGGVWFLDRLRRRLGIKEVLERPLKAREFRTPVERPLPSCWRPPTRRGAISSSAWPTC